MTDTETLLRKAAMAAGLTVLEERGGGLPWTVRNREGKVLTWHPLCQSGDALDLAVALSIAVYPPEGQGDDATASLPGPSGGWICVSVTIDASAATRRAITRAAAAIYDSQQEQGE